MNIFASHQFLVYGARIEPKKSSPLQRYFVRPSRMSNVCVHLWLLDKDTEKLNLSTYLKRTALNYISWIFYMRNYMLILLFHFLVSQLVCIFSSIIKEKDVFSLQEHWFLTNHNMEGSVIFHILCLLLWFCFPDVTEGQNGKCTCVVSHL